MSRRLWWLRCGRPVDGTARPSRRAAAVGVVGQLVLAGLALRSQRQHRRRMADLRQSMVEAAEE